MEYPTADDFESTYPVPEDMEKALDHLATLKEAIVALDDDGQHLIDWINQAENRFQFILMDGVVDIFGAAANQMADTLLDILIKSITDMMGLDDFGENPCNCRACTLRRAQAN
jgi:hypothetical protein